MIQAETDHYYPTEEPPREVSCEILWRLAVRLFREHQCDPTDPPRCAGCRQPWPCSGRRMAELGLSEAKA
jgi:hypothetical protein